MADDTLDPRYAEATIRYSWSWARALDGATITGTPTVVASGTGAPTVGSVSTTGTTTTFLLSAGAYNATAPILTLTATNSNGETLVFEVEAPIAQ